MPRIVRWAVAQVLREAGPVERGVLTRGARWGLADVADAWDLAIDIIADLCRDRTGRPRPLADCAAYIRTQFGHRLLNALEAAQAAKRKPAERLALDALSAEPAASVVDVPMRVDVGRALNALTAKQLRVVEGRMAGETLAEIAEAMKISRDTCKEHWERARDILRPLLTAYA